jgi:hypothetical protein
MYLQLQIPPASSLTTQVAQVQEELADRLAREVARLPPRGQQHQRKESTPLHGPQHSIADHALPILPSSPLALPPLAPA